MIEMSMQPSFQKPKITEFVPIGIGNKRVLPYAVRSANGDTYSDQYFPGIRQIEFAQWLYPELKLFVPSSVDICYLFEKVKPFFNGTGTVVLRPGKDGYADESVRYKDGEKVELHTPVVAHHGESWVTADNGKAMAITDYQKLREYPEIQVFKKYDWKYIRGFDKKVRGVPTKFSDKPSEEYNNARLYVKPELLISPLARGGCFERHREWLFDSNLFWNHDRPISGFSVTWSFSLGSEAPADSKQILHEKVSDLRKRVATIPTMSASEIPNCVRNLDKELKQLKNL